MASGRLGDAFAYSAAIGALQGRWRHALVLFEEMRDSWVVPSDTFMMWKEVESTRRTVCQKVFQKVQTNKLQKQVLCQTCLPMF